MEPRELAPEERPDDVVPEAEHVPVTVFWQRRAVVGLVLLALILGLTIAITSWRNRVAVADSGSVATTRETANPASSSSDPSASAPTAAPSTEAPPAAPAISCDVAQLVVRLSGPERVKAGTEAGLVTTFTNVGHEACTLPLNSSTFMLKVTSGTDEIWKSTDCVGWGPDSATALAAGQTLEWTTSWNRHRSNKCQVVSGDLRPGTYVATATWRNGPTARHVMILTW